MKNLITAFLLLAGAVGAYAIFQAGRIAFGLLELRLHGLPLIPIAGITGG